MRKYKLFFLTLFLICSLVSVKLVASHTGNINVCPSNCEFSKIQKAIDAASPGDTIIVKSGTYKENLNINKNLSLMSPSRAEVVIKGANQGEPILLVGRSEISVSIKGLTLTESKGYRCANEEEGVCPSGISITGKAKVDIEKSRFSNHEECGITLWDSSRAHITNSKVFRNVTGGVCLWPSSQVTITKSDISSNYIGLLAAGSSSVNLLSNYFSKNRVGIVSLSKKAVVGSKNQMVGNGINMIGNISGKVRLPLAQASQEKLEFPNPNHPTLQHAIDALIPGGTLLLNPGKYEAGVTITKNLTIKTKGNGKAQLTGKRGTEWDIVISLVSGADLKLEDCELSKGGGGLALGGTAKATIQQVVITENGNGILLFNSSQAIIRDSIISKNEVAGMEIWGRSQVILDGNQIFNNGNYGVRLGIRNCGYEDMTEELSFLVDFRGFVKGALNRFAGNEIGPVCPPELEFLSNQQGGEYYWWYRFKKPSFTFFTP